MCVFKFTEEHWVDCKVWSQSKRCTEMFIIADRDELKATVKLLEIDRKNHQIVVQPIDNTKSEDGKHS